MDDDDFYESNPWMIGGCYLISDSPMPVDVIAELHKIVEEITGQPVLKPQRKIGFY